MNKNLKLAVVITLLVLHIASFIRAFSYYQHFFSGLFGHERYYSSIVDTVRQSIYILTVFLEIALAVIFLASEGLYKDRVYKLLRYLFVINLLLHLPYTLYLYLNSDSYVYRMALPDLLLQVVFTLVNIACLVMFLMAKPESQVPPLDLSEYELVEYTSTGHRFVHRLLDLLFLAPVYIFWLQVLPGYFDDSAVMGQLLMVLIYLIYCFLSESIFRQTLGKIATKSCVTSIGGRLTAGRVLVRTLARLIPFDNVSFLFGANWHDKTTHTSVVYINTWEKVFEEPKQEDVVK